MVQASRIALYPAKKTIQQFCPKSAKAGNVRITKRLEKLMKLSSCVNKNLKKNDTCVRRFIGELQTVALTNEADKAKIPHVCW